MVWRCLHLLDGGVPQFCKIVQSVLVDNNIVFFARDTYYIEYLQSYELSLGNLTVHTLTEFNDTLSLSAYITAPNTKMVHFTTVKFLLIEG